MSDKDLLQIRQRLLDSMVEYMNPDVEEPELDYDCGYTQSEVDNCAQIVDAFLEAVAEKHALDEDTILRAVQSTVEKLNVLNESCDGCLIETDQREDLCELIISAAKKSGLESDEDVTEQWREW